MTQYGIRAKIQTTGDRRSVRRLTTLLQRACAAVDTSATPVRLTVTVFRSCDSAESAPGPLADPMGFHVVDDDGRSGSSVEVVIDAQTGA